MERTRGLIRPEDIAQLIANRKRQEPVQGTKQEIDFKPVVRLYIPFVSSACWLLSEMESDDIAFGLCDLGVGFPELGSVWLPELEELKVGPFRVLQDIDFKADKTIAQYARIASQHQRIVVEGDG